MFILNSYKFKDIFLYKLEKLISKFFNKKIEFNIINLRSIIFHPDLFTEYLKLKLKRKRPRIIQNMNIIMNKIQFPKEKIIKGKIPKNIDYNLLENKYKNLNINSLINEKNLYKRLEILYKNILLTKTYFNYDQTFIDNKKIILEKIKEKKKNLRKEIFDSIHYKYIRGIRLEIKGRLTWRYRADRSLYKVRWIGGLKNVDSSFKGLSTVNFRGYSNSNVEYSIRTSKRRIGAFAVKGWISGR